MERREFIKLLGGAAAAWPVVARAQQPAKPLIGYVSGRSRAESANIVAAFHQGLKKQALSRARMLQSKRVLRKVILI